MAAPVVGGGAGVSVTLQPPLSFILRQAGAFRRSLLDFRELWERFKPVMSALEAEQWDTAGRGEWPPLAESTLRYKSGELMVESGELRDSLVDPNRAMQISAMSAVYGTAVAYAHFHQDGGSVAGRPPQRQVIPDPFPVEARQQLETEMVRWINEKAAMTFGRIAA